jgi:hypothetical protein
MEERQAAVLPLAVRPAPAPVPAPALLDRVRFPAELTNREMVAITEVLHAWSAGRPIAEDDKDVVAGVLGRLQLDGLAWFEALRRFVRDEKIDRALAEMNLRRATR